MDVLGGRTWLTHDASYPLVSSSGIMQSHDLAIWFGLLADWVHYLHQYITPRLALVRIESPLDAIRHGQHNSSFAPCSVCDERRTFRELLDGL